MRWSPLGFALMLLAASSASASWSNTRLNQLGRWTGYGWSDGYHAYDACPSRRMVRKYGYPPVPSHGWTAPLPGLPQIQPLPPGGSIMKRLPIAPSEVERLPPPKE